MSFKGISIGCVTSPRKKSDLQRRLKERCEQGFDFIQISAETEWTERKRIDKEAPVLKKLLKKFPCKPYVHLPSFTHLGYPHTLAREDSIKEIAKCLESYSKLNVEKAVLHVGGILPPTLDEETIKKLGINSLRRLQKKANDLNIMLLLENGGSPISSSFEKLSQICKKAKIKICLDTGHAIISGHNEKEICDFLKKNKDIVPDFHLHDAVKDTRNNHLPLGCGTINFEQIFLCLKEIGWKGGLCLEVGSYLMESRKRLLELLKKIYKD